MNLKTKRVIQFLFICLSNDFGWLLETSTCAKQQLTTHFLGVPRSSPNIGLHTLMGRWPDHGMLHNAHLELVRFHNRMLSQHKTQLSRIYHSEGLLNSVVVKNLLKYGEKDSDNIYETVLSWRESCDKVTNNLSCVKKLLRNICFMMLFTMSLIVQNLMF